LRIVLSLFFLLSLVAFGDSSYGVQFESKKKQSFINDLLPAIIEENNNIAKEREFVNEFFSKEFFLKLNGPNKQQNIQKLAKIADKYKINDLFNKDEYLKKVDMIPPSMAVAQAVLETGWGQSEYARELNNYYGHYVFSKKLGFEGKAVKGKYERIRVFEDIKDSVKAYMLNLNTHIAYKGFRDARVRHRLAGGFIAGDSAIEYLTKYSILKGNYIKRVKDVIYDNDLSIFDATIADVNNFRPNELVSLY
jgi:Bax protein